VKTYNPFVPSVTLINVPSRHRRERVRKVIYTVLAAHVVFLLCLLLVEFRHDPVVYARELPHDGTSPTADSPKAVADPIATAATGRPSASSPLVASIAPAAKPTSTVAKSTPNPAPSRPETYYTVLSGDTLESIAKKYDSTVSAIRAANSLTTDRLLVSQKLKIP
jgi:hypothetical protein